MITMNAETNDSGAAIAPQGAGVAPEKPVAKKAPSRKKGAGNAAKSAAGSKSAKSTNKGKKTTHQETAPRKESQSGKILELIGRAKGAMLAEIMEATGWQAHSVRGFLSTAGKKRKVKIESTKNEAGRRLYRIRD